MKAFIFFGMQSDFGFRWAMLLLVIPLGLRLWWDYHTIVNQKKEVDHAAHTILTGVMMAVVSVFDWVFGPAKYFIQPLIFQWAIFVLLFDYVLNLLRGLDWWYVDEGLDGKQSWMDSIYTQLPWWAIMFVKIWVFLLGFSVYFFISYVV